jgi:hypothetical protein
MYRKLSRGRDLRWNIAQVVLPDPMGESITVILDILILLYAY